MPDLVTRDFTDVEIMTPGTWQGRGCPPGGCAFTPEILGEIVVDTNAAFAENFTAPVKLGHDQQTLLEQQELPAAGWLENVRLVGERVLADVKKVPNRIADIMEAGGWRNRSVELQRRNGKLVLSGLALLGAKLPAIDTLNDIEALYASLELGEPSEMVLMFVNSDDVDHTNEWLDKIVERHPTVKKQIDAVKLTIDGGNDVELTAIAEKLGLGDDATEESVLAAIEELNKPEEKPDDTPEVKPDDTPEVIAASAKEGQEVTRLSARVLELETAAASATASAAVEAAIDAGKLLPAQREQSMTFAIHDLDGFNTFVKNAPKVLSFGERGTSNDATDGDEGDFEPTKLELEVGAQLGNTREMIIVDKKLAADVQPTGEELKLARGDDEDK